jgi:formamidopyrimidine-DNA glycosylase
MPELPEVETVARQLQPHLVGRTVESLSISDPLLRPGPVPRVAGRTITEVRRAGKQVLIAFDGARPLWLTVHLRMTGRLIWADSAEQTDPYLRARFDLDQGSLLFADTRRFGTFHWHRDEASTRPVGLDPVLPEFTEERLATLAARAKQPLKSFLLRQDRIVGIGNIYASEICWDARLSPRRRASSLRPTELRRLHASTVKILQRAIDNCGTTFSDFQDAHGLTGSYQQFLAVYSRGGEPCPRCEKPVRRIVQQQRSTFYCGGCQR